MNYYERHIGDYLKDTSHLSLLEHGVYTRLLDVYYTREAPIPQADVARLIGARSKDEREALNTVLREFFVPDQDPPTEWLQARCEREIDRFKDKQAKAKRSAEARWSAQRSDSEGNANASPNAMRTHSEGNAPSNQTPDPIHSELKLASAFPVEKPGAQLALVDGGKPPAGVPDCPHRAVLALWAEELPALPQHNPQLWRGARASHLRARWRETAAAKGWTSEGQGIEYMRRLFRYVAQSRFLTGRAPAAPGRQPFVADLAWLVQPEAWAKVIEGKYHSEAA